MAILLWASFQMYIIAKRTMVGACYYRHSTVGHMILHTGNPTEIRDSFIPTQSYTAHNYILFFDHRARV